MMSTLRTDTRTVRWLFGGLVLLSTILVSRGPNTLTGPAPHILAVSHSIAHDGDLDVSNQYDPRSRYVFASMIAGHERRSRAAIVAREARLVPTDGLGLALALTPPLVAVERLVSSLPISLLDRVRWDRSRAVRDLLSFVMAMLAAWVAVLTFRLARGLGYQPLVVGPIVALAWATPPLIYGSVLIGPEIPGALLLIWFALTSLRDRSMPWVLGVPLALLPWIDRSYILLSIVGLLWLAARARRQTAGHWKHIVLQSAIAPAASMALLGCTNVWLLGEVLPTRYSDLLPSLIGFSGLPGLLVGPDTGLLVVAPFWILGILGLRALHRTHRDLAWLAAGMGVGACGAAALSMPVGPAGTPPGIRFIPALPLLAPAAIACWAALGKVTWTRRLASAAVIWSLLMTASVVARPSRMWPSAGESVSRSYAGVITRLQAPGRARANLAASGVDVNTASLRDAARAGDLETVGLLVAAGADPTQALVAAASNNRTSVLQELLEDGKADGPEGARALAWASYYESTEAVDLLRSAGANPAATNAGGEGALLIAATLGAREELLMLAASGARVDAQSRTGRTALMATVERDDLQTMLVVLRLGADPNVADRDGLTALHRAALAGRTPVAAALIGDGANVNAISRLGWTPMMRAAHEGHVDVVGELLTAGADPNIVTKGGQSALVRAIQRRHGPCVRALVAGGADPIARVEGLDAREWARLGGDRTVLDALGEEGGS